MSHFKIIFILYNDLKPLKICIFAEKVISWFSCRRAKMFTGVLIQATDEVNERNEVNEIL